MEFHVEMRIGEVHAGVSWVALAEVGVAVAEVGTREQVAVEVERKFSRVGAQVVTPRQAIDERRGQTRLAGTRVEAALQHGIAEGECVAAVARISVHRWRQMSSPRRRRSKSSVVSGDGSAASSARSSRRNDW